MKSAAQLNYSLLIVHFYCFLKIPEVSIAIKNISVSFKIHPRIKSLRNTPSASLHVTVLCFARDWVCQSLGPNNGHLALTPVLRCQNYFFSLPPPLCYLLSNGLSQIDIGWEEKKMLNLSKNQKTLRNNECKYPCNKTIIKFLSGNRSSL